jgi:hypothetical protein
MTKSVLSPELYNFAFPGFDLGGIISGLFRLKEPLGGDNCIHFAKALINQCCLEFQ